jgi:hypothetical protein
MRENTPKSEDNKETHLENPGIERMIILELISKKYECNCVACTARAQERVQCLSLLKAVKVTSDKIYQSTAYN